MLLVHLRRHELGRPDHGLGEALVLERGQAEVAYLDAAGGSGDEDVITLQVSVDHGRDAGVQEQQSSQDLTTPGLQNLRI